MQELVYSTYTKYNSVETPQFKETINPLDKILLSLAAAEETDKYMNIVFTLYSVYECQSYIEGIKVEARLMVERIEG